jgi:hypothetical protein
MVPIRSIIALLFGAVSVSAFAPSVHNAAPVR